MTFRLSFFPAIALGLAMACMFAAPASAATIDFSPLTSLANDFVQSLVSLLASVIVGGAAWAAKRWFGLQVDAKQRESLHGAIERGISGALDVALKKLDGKTILEIDNEVIAQAANYVVKLSPDAVKYFKLTPDKLADLIAAKLGERFLLDADIDAQPSA